MEEIKSAVRALFLLDKEREIINKFAQEEYNKKFKDMIRHDGTYHGYDGYEIINDHTICVKYTYGTLYGDFDCYGSFDVDLTQYGIEK